MEVAGSAATILQLVSFTGEVLIAGYGYLSKVEKAPAEIRSLLKETANLNALLDQFQALVTEDNGPHVLSALETLTFLDVFGECRTLMKVVLKSIKACEQISHQSARNLGRRLLWPFKDKETKEALQQLERLRLTLSAAVAVDSAKSLIHLEEIAKLIDINVIKILDTSMQVHGIAHQTAEDLAQLNLAFSKKTISDEAASTRGWLLPTGIDSEADFETASRLRHPSTGQWFLDSDIFHDWLEFANGLIWAYGIPGCGKTVLSATVIEHLRATYEPKTSVVLYFFYNHRVPGKQTFQNCLHVLIKQLVDSNLDCFNEAKQCYQERMNKSVGQQGTPAVLSVEENIGLIKQLCSRFDTVFMVVDALDECADRTAFSDGLQILRQGMKNIKILLTSRQEVELERLITPIASYRLGLKEHMGSDIKTYLTAEISTRIGQGSLKLGRQSIVADIVARIEEKADGMILIAKLQLDYLCRLRSVRAIKEALTKLPSGINATYDEIIQQLCSQYPESVDDIRTILRWLIGSRVPLTLDQVAEAVSIQPEDVRLDRDGIATDPADLAALCGSLVTVQTEGTRYSYPDDLRGPRTTLISLSHASVEEYITSPTIKQGPSKSFYMDLSIVHRELAATCLQYVGFEDFQKPIQSISKSSNHKRLTYLANRESLKKRTNQYVLYDYACTYWSEHLRLSTVLNDRGIAELLAWFLVPERYSGTYASWQQMYHRDIHHYCPGRPQLHYAIDFEIPFLIKVLLPAPENINTLYHGMAALHEAAKRGDFDTCVTLLDEGALLELKSGQNTKQMTALHFAAEYGHPQIIKLLLESGAYPGAQSLSQSTPFYRAARSGSLEALRLLYSAGSDIDARTWDNWTALFESIIRGLVHIASQLLEWGADPTIVTHGGESALSVISAARNHDKILSQSTEDIMLNLGSEASKDQDFWKTIESREAETLREIQELQARAQASPAATGDTFCDYLNNLDPGYWRLERIENDTRSGIERDLSRFILEDGATRFSPEGYLISNPPSANQPDLYGLSPSNSCLRRSRSGVRTVNSVDTVDSRLKVNYY